ncbi:6153_t:CDS:2 [Paraglomus brasilianum]|uniref:6153_t:CDS:1 n=1 Tax=Paraglomus brasilianum TaxID=144538 RepID=A0A9N9D1A4_9GLOM|nr:6153_t:CDS:2 [Paraglomus brasilianum]
MLEDKLALAQKDVSEKNFDLNKLKIEPTRLRLEATHKLTLEAAEAALLHKFDLLNNGTPEFSLRPFLIKKPSSESIKSSDIDSEKQSSINNSTQNIEQTKSDSHISIGE